MNEKFFQRVKRNDRIARWVITLGGLAIIFSVILILLLIVRVTLPLFQSPQAQISAGFSLGAQQGAETLAVGLDEYLETGFSIDSLGRFSFFDARSGAALDTLEVVRPEGASALTSVETIGGQRYGLLWDNGALSVEKVNFRPTFDAADGNRRTIAHSLAEQVVLPAGLEGEEFVQSLGRTGSEGRKTRVDLLSDGRLHVAQQEVTENLLGDEEVADFSQTLDVPTEGRILSLVLDSAAKTLYAGTDRGQLLSWNLSEAGSAELMDQTLAFSDRRGITALAMVFGDVSLAVGDAKGEVSTWMMVRETEVGNARKLRLIHPLSRHGAAVTRLIASPRDKSVLSLDAKGEVHIDHMTSERHLLSLSAPGGLSRLCLNGRGDGLLGLAPDGQALVWALDIPHPEVSLKTLFGKVWYEGYAGPEYSWQSSSGSDDFEPKLSLVPLIFGTLKGTFYAMILAVPLALFGAVYTSQFARPAARAFIKPAIEVMAAIPTVIIGFLAALWLAPLVERSLGAVFFSFILLPVGLILALLAWQGLRRRPALKRIERGYEFLAIIPVLILAVAIASVLGPWVESHFFAGNLKQWLFTEWGTKYDPRNCIIIAFAMGFAVIPIVFTISEDALSNVPPSLKAASLALGASRWQTVWRVILPSASPGIFAGAMIGFGRAVGETMIVLMATGNTAIMDLSIFNGMRPLSANIAVEIPEAPVDGSLYRVLFLSAVILFVMTFVVNTAAELVRQRLRKKYGRF